MQNRDLGSLGETEFKRLCHSVGLTVHKSEMDRTGWDFLVEFPWKDDNRFPQDILSAPIECKIQVKSTDKQRKRELITLSNLNRLIKTPLPAFFCFIEFDGEDKSQAVYLVHVGKEIIEKTLKRIRELENEGSADKLNKHKLNITYGDVNRLEDVTGKSLKSGIEKHTPDGLEKYIENKNKLLETLGFEEGKYQADITIVSDDPIRDILDLTLGLRKEINMHHSTGYHKRFGILSKKPDMDYDGGILSLQVKPLEARLKFKEHKFSPGISLSAKLYISPFSKFISEERIKFRVESRFFEIIIELGQRINCSIRPHAEGSSLKELKDFLKVLSVLEKSSNPLLVELESEIAPSCPIMTLSSKDLPPSFFETSIINEQVYNWSRLDQLVEMALEICRKVHISEDDVLIKIEDLISFSRYADVPLLYQALHGDAEAVILYFSIELEEYQQGAKAASIFFVKACIGNYIIGCCLGVVGSLSLLGEQHSLVGEKFLVGQQFIGTDDTVISKELVDLGLNELVEELQDEELAVVTVLS